MQKRNGPTAADVCPEADIDLELRIARGIVAADEDGCPQCGELRMDSLVWQDDDSLRCTTCGTRYSLDAETTDGGPTHGDYADEAESAQRAGAWPQAAALWRRAAETCEDAERKAKYLANARWCDDMPGVAGETQHDDAQE